MDVNSPEAAEWSDLMRRNSALEAENARLREALGQIIDLDHHNHGPERRATKIARAARNGEASALLD